MPTMLATLLRKFAKTLYLPSNSRSRRLMKRSWLTLFASGRCRSAMVLSRKKTRSRKKLEKEERKRLKLERKQRRDRYSRSPSPLDDRNRSRSRSPNRYSRSRHSVVEVLLTDVLHHYPHALATVTEAAAKTNIIHDVILTAVLRRRITAVTIAPLATRVGVTMTNLLEPTDADPCLMIDRRIWETCAQFEQGEIRSPHSCETNTHKCAPCPYI